MRIIYLVLGFALSAAQVAASSTFDAAVGGGLGGAAGAAIGNEVGGREGAIIGGALGGAAGAAVTTDEPTVQLPQPERVRVIYAPYIDGHPHSYHCPPGQGKKGRC